MNNKPMNKKLIQSYVLEKYFISTIYRESSALVEEPYNWYYETMVWEWNAANRKKEKLINTIYSGVTADKALETHFTWCQRLKEIESLKGNDNE